MCSRCSVTEWMTLPAAVSIASDGILYVKGTTNTKENTNATRYGLLVVWWFKVRGNSGEFGLSSGHAEP